MIRGLKGRRDDEVIALVARREGEVVLWWHGGTEGQWFQRNPYGTFLYQSQGQAEKALRRVQRGFWGKWAELEGYELALLNVDQLRLSEVEWRIRSGFAI